MSYSLSTHARRLKLFLDLFNLLPNPKGLELDAAYTKLKMVTDQPASTIYRIHIDADNTVDVTCIGLESIDSALEGTYDSLDTLPEWVQGRIAVLSMLSATPPTQDIPSVGRRITNRTYWVYKPTT
jgi:radical SAM superfamily enzyme with C-terminal helix-hairpin-helix motif